jgi:hypothetical protein
MEARGTSRADKLPVHVSLGDTASASSTTNKRRGGHKHHRRSAGRNYGPLCICLFGSFALIGLYLYVLGPIFLWTASLNNTTDPAASVQDGGSTNSKAPTLFDFAVSMNNGQKELHLDQLRGHYKAFLVVNVASN